MAEPTPAGWFTDPTGRHEHRYWDGSAWTEHVASGGVVTADAIDLAPAVSVEKRSRTRTPAFAAAAIALVAIVGVAAVVATSSSGGSNPSSVTASSNPSSSGGSGSGGSRPANSHVTLDTCANETSIIDGRHGAVAGGDLSIDAPEGGGSGLGVGQDELDYVVKIGYFQDGKLIDEKTAHAHPYPGLTSGRFSVLRREITGVFTCKVLDVHRVS